MFRWRTFWGAMERRLASSPPCRATLAETIVAATGVLTDDSSPDVSVTPVSRSAERSTTAPCPRNRIEFRRHRTTVRRRGCDRHASEAHLRSPIPCRDAGVDQLEDRGHTCQQFTVICRPCSSLMRGTDADDHVLRHAGCQYTRDGDDSFITGLMVTTADRQRRRRWFRRCGWQPGRG